MPSPAQATEDAMKQPPKIPIEQANWALTWAATINHKSKLMLLCDGRNRQSRRILEDWVDLNYADATRSVEGLVHYVHMTRDVDPRFPKRKVAFSDNIREHIYVCLPVPKVNIRSKSRQAYVAGDEHSTHSSTYSRVISRPLEHLPRLCADSREAILGKAGVEPEDMPKQFKAEVKQHGGQPLFWQEFKPVKLWTAFFADFGINCVFDLTPGSGCAAIAALYAGEQFHQ
jgi:hypothetical protein